MPPSAQKLHESMGKQRLWEVGAHLEPVECHSEERNATKNLEILRPALGGTQDDNCSLREACPELAEGLRMTLIVIFSAAC